MRGKRLFFITLCAVACAAGVWAQEPAEDEDQPPPEQTRPIRFRENPYEIAAYRYFSGAMQRGAYGQYAERYPMAGFYRQRRPMGGRYGYSRFWADGGYGYGRGLSRGYWLGYRQSIGQNGDLCLFAPTILATVGPLTGVFSEGR